MAAQGIAVTAVINILVCREGGGSLFIRSTLPPLISDTPVTELVRVAQLAACQQMLSTFCTQALVEIFATIAIKMP